MNITKLRSDKIGLAIKWLIRKINIFDKNIIENVVADLHSDALQRAEAAREQKIIYGFDYEHEISPILIKKMIDYQAPLKFTTYYKPQVIIDNLHFSVECRLGDSYEHQSRKYNDLKFQLHIGIGDVWPDFIDKTGKMKYDFTKYSTQEHYRELEKKSKNKTSWER